MGFQLKHAWWMSITIAGIAVAFIVGFYSGNEGSVDPYIYGKWDFFELHEMEMSARITLDFQHDKLVSSNSCSYKDYSINVQAVSPAIITGKKIKILSSSHNMKEHSPGFLKCKASLDKGTVHYQLRNDTLLLTRQGESERAELSRSGQVFRPARLYKN